ncbi:MAG: ATPase domain-containing protein [Nitrososphaera sp.]|jgi:KaiC/GvpD/RAD55 family RecA-like ATPase/class 3 adenylate cyclase
MESNTLLPGQEFILASGNHIPRSVLLVLGTAGSGKTAYSLEFLRSGLSAGEKCLYMNCSSRLRRERFESFFGGEAKPQFESLLDEKTNKLKTLQNLSGFLLSWLDAQVDTSKTRIVIDSITDLTVRFAFDEVTRLVAELYDKLSASNSAAILTIAGNSPTAPMLDTLGSLVDGIIQLKVEDSGNEVQRSMRLFSLQSGQGNSRWVKYTIDANGSLHFIAPDGDSSRPKAVYCKLCDRQIIGEVAYADSGQSPFHPHCFDTYRKIGELYGSHMLYSLEPGVVNASFFFIDIVGLSNPLLSVEKQINKIRDLNSLILSCEAFSKVAKDRKIVLPTGDGMAVGFLLDPELPMQLSIQLHKKLRQFNAGKSPEDHLGVRIGLSTGPVFVVRDVNNNQNVWGPGIILARRVMDFGDDGHVLLADNIAETLIGIKDEYRKEIRLLKEAQKLKHGQALKIYSAHSEEFGNSAVPARLDLS